MLIARDYSRKSAAKVLQKMQIRKKNCKKFTFDAIFVCISFVISQNLCTFVD